MRTQTIKALLGIPRAHGLVITTARAACKLLIVKARKAGNDTLAARLSEAYAALKAKVHRSFNGCVDCGVPISHGKERCFIHFIQHRRETGDVRLKKIAKVAILFLTLALVGCAITKPKSQVSLPKSQVLMPPPITQSPRTPTVAAPVTHYLSWDFKTDSGDPIALPQEDTVFEVWHTTDLTQPFTLWTNVDMPPVQIGGQAQEFFIVRTRDTITGEVSDWARRL